MLQSITIFKAIVSRYRYSSEFAVSLTPPSQAPQCHTVAMKHTSNTGSLESPYLLDKKICYFQNMDTVYFELDCK